MALLEVKNLRVNINGHQILKDVDFEIGAGKIAAVIGPNGSGKTTLFKAILGLIDHKGKVTMDGRDMSRSLTSVGYVPQQFSFDRSLPINVREFLRFHLAAGQNKADIEEALEQARIEKLAGKMFGTLSGGQMQRVLIAAALLKRPKLLLLDEALAGIDIEGEQDFYKLILRLSHHEGLAVLMISHEINMVYKFADQIICLNKSMICSGKPAEVVNRHVLEQLYGRHIEYKLHNHNHE